MVFGLSTEWLLGILIFVAIVFFILGFFVRKLLKLFLILGILLLIFAGFLWWF